MLRRPRPRPLPLRLLDERDPAGGRIKAIAFLTHPGPSLLVTAVTLGAGGLALGSPPPPRLAARMTVVMLPAQLAIGIVNDLADREGDRSAKPHKPLVRGAVRTSTSAALAATCCATSVAAAATLGPTALAATAVGLGAGLAYDLGLKRSPWSWATWWAGFSALPVFAHAAAGRSDREVWWAIPIAAPLSLGLLCANALPDVAGDAAAGARSLPVRLGATASRTVTAVACVAAAAAAGALPPRRPPGRPLRLARAALASAGLATIALPHRLAARAAFPLTAASAALLAVAWLHSVERG